MGILDKLKTKKPAVEKKEVDKKATPKKAKAAPKKAAPAKKEAAEKVSATKPGKTTGNASQVLIRPMVTEKTTELASQGKYVFEVSMRSNKIEVAQAIKDLYKVDVEKVNIMVNRGKAVAFGRTLGKRKDFKKAIVSLKKGQSIEVFEGV